MDSIALDDSNRYLIYTMLGRDVEVTLPRRHGQKKLSGRVDHVCRNIFDNMVELTLSGHQHRFQEPSAIVNSGKRLLFVYGDVGTEDMSDEELFDEARVVAHSGENVNDILDRTQSSPTYTLEINMGPKINRKAARRMRGKGISC